MPKDDGKPAISKEAKVRQALGAAPRKPLAVSEDEPLDAVAARLGDQPGVHTVAVVDAANRLLGIIPMRILLDELFFLVAPEEFLVEMREMAGVEEFGRISRAEKARDLMQDPVYVTLEDTVRDAFVRMHEAKLEGLPIVDEAMKVVGYLDRFQLLRLWLESRPKK